MYRELGYRLQCADAAVLRSQIADDTNMSKLLDPPRTSSEANTIDYPVRTAYIIDLG
jgi:hypothetical protein